MSVFSADYTISSKKETNFTNEKYTKDPEEIIQARIYIQITEICNESALRDAIDSLYTRQ